MAYITGHPAHILHRGVKAVLRVASYCRVSTEKEDQQNSFASQKRFFQQYIALHADWELYGVYADEGITGTCTGKRTAFNRMIGDAERGCFQLIVTKEVSRFSRNILDTIWFTRRLRQAGVGVLFLNDGICTLDADAELRLGILGTIAQEESRRTSSRVKWGQTRRMEQGVVFGRSLLGYDVRGGRLYREPSGAETVETIFRLYTEEGKGAAAVARALEAQGRRTAAGGTRWTAAGVAKILRNEKYAGDLVQKKTFTPDFLTHAKKRNWGEEALIVLRDHHEPLVSRETWNAAQAELRRRNRRGGENGAGRGNRYFLSGRILCGECGGPFVARKRTRTDGTSYLVWRCGRGGRCAVGWQLRDDRARALLAQFFGTASPAVGYGTGAFSLTVRKDRSVAVSGGSPARTQVFPAENGRPKPNL